MVRRKYYFISNILQHVEYRYIWDSVKSKGNYVIISDFKIYRLYTSVEGFLSNNIRRVSQKTTTGNNIILWGSALLREDNKLTLFLKTINTVFQFHKVNKKIYRFISNCKTALYLDPSVGGSKSMIHPNPVVYWKIKSTNVDIHLITIKSKLIIWHSSYLKCIQYDNAVHQWYLLINNQVLIVGIHCRLVLIVASNLHVIEMFKYWLPPSQM